MLGHSSLQMTRRYVSSLSQEDMTNLCRMVDAVYKLVPTS